MKQMMLGVALIAAVGAVAGAQSGGGSVRDEVVAAQKKFYQAYQACSAKDMEGLVTDDMVYLHSTGGVQKSKAELLKSLTPDCPIEKLRVDVTNVRIYGDTAIVSGDLHFKAKGAPEVAAHLLATQVFVKQNGRWLLANNSSMEPVPLDTSVRLAAHQK